MQICVFEQPDIFDVCLVECLFDLFDFYSFGFFFPQGWPENIMRVMFLKCNV